MNDVAARQAAADPATTVDASNPWLGLASFTEETRAYFFGREEEVAELARRVQRKLLTLLFGQSGLGKTSILRAGLVPRLRSQGYCPIYVRIDYSHDTPEPAEQIKRAIIANARRSGQWTQVGVAVEGESLWEFLHHRDDVLLDESGKPLIPLLIFDQFEEIFTLAQSDAFGRARAARFVSELADLVENRPPKALEARFEEDDSAAGRFDFARSDYRVLIALREDYLAPLEGLKKEIPSISQNRLRLAPMSGTQALAAVLQPGKRLVSEEVAAAIVRFVAGGAELSNAVVEPSLLSLICRELNDARIAQGRSEISLDLLAGSHATILENFYERSLADQPAAVRRIIEDELLTDSGYRENVAEERLVSRFTEAGAAPETLAVLVNRRLLRIEERLDVRRVELTHDVLCGVVRASRDKRHERESREATERLLAEQKERELAARRAAARARQIAAGCTVLAILALGAAVFGYLSSERARRAERLAQETRAMADTARGNAEHLLGYLTEDFAPELENFGRLDVLGEFAKRQVDYFHALPPVLQGTETTRNGALALVYQSKALRGLGNVDVAGASVDEALHLLQGLWARGDHSEATAIALSLAYTAKGRVLDNRNDPAKLPTSERAARLLEPFVQAPHASVAVRRAYVEALTRLGYEQGQASQREKAVRTEEEAQRVAAELGARDLSNIDMAAYYAEAGAWRVDELTNLGRNEEAQRAGDAAAAVGDKVLERRPGYRLALHAEGIIWDSLSSAAQNDLNPAEAVRAALRGEQTALTLLNLDPGNIVSNNNLGSVHQTLCNALWAGGRLHEAIPYCFKSLENMERASAGGVNFHINRGYAAGLLTFYQMDVGDTAGAQATLARGPPFLAKVRQSEPPGTNTLRLVEVLANMAAMTFAFESNDLATARRLATDAVSELHGLTPHGDFQAHQKHLTLWVVQHFFMTPVAYELGDFATVERAEREALEEQAATGDQAVGDQRTRAGMLTYLAMALARQGRLAEAAKTIAPAVALERALLARNHGDRWVAMELAGALYAQALCDPGRRAPLLSEAAGLIDGLAPEVRGTHEARRWRARIQQALQSRVGASDAALATQHAG
jgi:hypothetical protein